MGFFGNLLGGAGGTILGAGLGQAFGGQKGAATGANIGGQIGKIAGDLIPFKKGGRVRKTGAILAHKGEVVLPAGVPPTMAQKRAIRKRGGKI